MNRVIRVECWADFYFFGRLLLDKAIIRKEKNKAEVFKSIRERSNGEFSIGIVDSDNDTIEPFLGDLIIEDRFFVCKEVELIKVKGYHYYIIQLYPKEFEKWIESFLKNSCNKNLIDFGYNNYKEFEEDSKVIPDKLNKNERFINLINYVLDNHDNTDNQIKKIKSVLRYLINNTYKADINELKNV